LQKANASSALTSTKYSRFSEIDGTHDFKDHVPHGYVLYPVRELNKGQILFFNFPLAKEMGLLDSNHPEIITKELEKVLLSTFCIQIVNEYDQQHANLKKWKIKPNKYMATRYLQIQHKSNSGKTSGDGRSIWLGQFKNKVDTWDISARGTGVTCFSPAYAQTNQPLKSGNTDFGYGCGTVDLDELLGTCLQSEIFHKNGINTERTLLIVKTGAKIGIGVRVGKNLFRPAHLFFSLRQKNIKRLEQALLYFKTRIAVNQKTLKEVSIKSNRFYVWLITEMARFTALLERNYIFLWMEWDGDNLLLEPGIIDYGSIRQFGSYHNEYRYDDITSWSTNLTEQKSKARHICKMYVQVMLSLNTGKPVPLKQIDRHPLLQLFDKEYERHQLRLFFYSLGFDDSQFKMLKSRTYNRLKLVFLNFHTLEKRKESLKFYDTGDGKNRSPKFDMRKFLAHYPRIIAMKSSLGSDFAVEFLNSENLAKVSKADTQLFLSLIKDLSELASEIFNTSSIKESTWKANVEQRNPLNRMTGNAIIMTVDRLIRIKDPKVLSEVMNGVIKAQGDLIPNVVLKSPTAQTQLKKINELIHRYRTDI
jgi:hypothetical protein